MFKLPPNKLQTLVMLVLHMGALGALIYLPFYGTSVAEVTFHLIAYLLGGLGITLLYHRVWTHNAAQIWRPLEYLFSCFASFIVQGPGIRWVKDHIAHHQHTDTEKDPYNINEGFWWAHIEWIAYQPTTEMRLPARLAANPVLHWQDKYYAPIALFFNIGLPLLVLMPLVEQPWWGLVLVSALRITVCNHVIWCVNSICHTFGKRPFTHDVTARNVWWFPVMLGEQYHNYHHAFPRDYRNGIRWFDFDPTKWLIALFAKLGLASNLYTTGEEKITAARQSTRPQTAEPQATPPLELAKPS